MLVSTSVVPARHFLHILTLFKEEVVRHPFGDNFSGNASREIRVRVERHLIQRRTPRTERKLRRRRRPARRASPSSARGASKKYGGEDVNCPRLPATATPPIASANTPTAEAICFLLENPPLASSSRSRRCVSSVVVILCVVIVFVDHQKELFFFGSVAPKNYDVPTHTYLKGCCGAARVKH